MVSRTYLNSFTESSLEVTHEWVCTYGPTLSTLSTLVQHSDPNALGMVEHTDFTAQHFFPRRMFVLSLPGRMRTCMRPRSYAEIYGPGQARNNLIADPKELKDVD